MSVSRYELIQFLYFFFFFLSYIIYTLYYLFIWFQLFHTFVFVFITVLLCIIIISTNLYLINIFHLTYFHSFFRVYANVNQNNPEDYYVYDKLTIETG